MGLQFNSLPSRLPAGTRFIIEGRNGRIHLRCLEFPDGARIVLSTDLVERPVTRRAPRSAIRKLTSKKKSSAAGTTRRLAS
jgi:hypothetical protein